MKKKETDVFFLILRLNTADRRSILVQMINIEVSTLKVYAGKTLSGTSHIRSYFESLGVIWREIKRESQCLHCRGQGGVYDTAII